MSLNQDGRPLEGDTGPRGVDTPDPEPGATRCLRLERPDLQGFSRNQVMARNWLFEIDGNRIEPVLGRQVGHTMRRHRMVGTVGGFILAGLAAAVPGAPGELRAEELQVAEEQFGSTFARVRYLEDSLTIRPAQRGEPAESGVNAPVTQGDVVVADGGRVEIVLADGSVVWLEDETALEFTTMADVAGRFEKTTLLALQSGTVRIDAVEPDPRDKAFRIDTEAGSIYLMSGGSYRLETDARSTRVAVFRGSAELSGDRGSVLIRSGYRSSVRPGEAPANPETFNIRRLDDFDEFCADRREAFEGNQEIPAEAEAEIPPEVRPYAYELSYYGAWHNVPVYGWVWRPVYYGSWAPYWNGYWSWSSTGWLWASYDAWGWAPYRYGRWDHLVNIGWVWIPGGVWRGAWVSFAVGTGYVGWSPLNYWNRAVFHGAHVGHPAHYDPRHLDGRAWRFVPVGHFSARDQARHAMRPDRLPAVGRVTVTGRLPHFSPRDVAARPERARALSEKVRTGRVDFPEGNADRPVPFRNLERRAARTPAPAGRAQATPVPARPKREAIRPSAPQVQGPGVRPRSQVREGTPRPRRIETPVAPPRTRPAPNPRVDRPGTQRSDPQGVRPGTTRRPPAQGQTGQGRVAPPAARKSPGVPPARPGSSPARPGATPAPGQDKPSATTPKGRSGRYIEQLFQGARRQRVKPPDQPAAPKSNPPPAARDSNRGRSSGEARGQKSSQGSGSSRGSGSNRGQDKGGQKR